MPRRNLNYKCRSRIPSLGSTDDPADSGVAGVGDLEEAGAEALQLVGGEDEPVVEGAAHTAVARVRQVSLVRGQNLLAKTELSLEKLKLVKC
jgi:hypothetical protein